MKSNIALIGFMGAGKSAVGRALAEKLNMEFVEMDALVMERTKKSVAEIFKQDGEPAFRGIEAEIARDVAREERGSHRLRRRHCAHPLQYRCSQRDLRGNLSQGAAVRGTGARGLGRARAPLLEVPDPASAVQELLKFRKPLYEKAADITIDTSDLAVQDIVDQIAAWWRKMRALISKSNIYGVVKAPSSKSYPLRAQICAALAEGTSEIIDPLLADDTEAALEVLGKIGVHVEQGNDAWLVSGGHFKQPVSDLNCRDRRVRCAL